MSNWLPITRMLLASTALVPLGTGMAFANPQGASVVGGAATVHGTGTSTVTVRQSTDRAIIDWRTFNIGTGETTRFVQPGATSIALNRVTGGLGPSVIDGTLTANGRVFLINPDGMLFGAGARINTGGFLATTSNITNQDFMAGRMNFNIPGRPDASIINHGTITAHSHGFAALVAPGVRNTGTISATLGTVALASGNTFSLDFYGDKLITLGVGDAVAGQVRDVATGEPLKALVSNEGKLRANGGRVELSAASARTVVDAVINTSGVIEARSIGRRGGMIVLGGATASTKGAGAPTQVVRVSGRLDVSSKGGKGGKIRVEGEEIRVASARIDASGRKGGGTVLIGGDVGGGKGNAAAAGIAKAALDATPMQNATNVSVDAASVIDVSARTRGDGGKAVVWADGTTGFAGAIYGRGGARGGNGGFAEVSGKQTLAFTGSANLSASLGKAGTLLLDPADFYIAVSETQAPQGASFMSAATLSALLTNQDVIIATDNAANPTGQNGDIFVKSRVEWAGNTTLTLSAYRNIEAATSGGQAVLVNTGGGNLVMRADSTGTGTGRVDFLGNSAPVDFSASTGKVSIFYNPNNGNYATPTNYSPAVLTNGAISGQMMAYMLVNNGAQLQNLGANPIGFYALGRDIDLGVGPGIGSPNNFTPIASFGGVLEGQGHTIRNLRLVTASTVPMTDIGLFRLVDTGGVVRNLSLTDASVSWSGSASPSGVGILAGRNAGLIENVHVSGTVTANSAFSSVEGAGGLVGVNGKGSIFSPVHVGTIRNSSADVTITMTGGPFSNAVVGGLVGFNPGRIENSSATGVITLDVNGVAGGLVGANGALANPNTNGPVPTIVGSSANTIVYSTASTATLGGLVGANYQGSIEGSSASGQVSHFRSALDLIACGTNCANSSVGGLAGSNDGTITGSTATAGVLAHTFGEAGGLVGHNSGSISKSTAAGTVVSLGLAGGLVGLNNAAGAITDSHASGTVSAQTLLGAPNPAVAGGLVGGNGGRIERTSSNAVVVGIDAVLGGLVGYNAAYGHHGVVTGYGTIVQSHANGIVLNLAVNGGGVSGGLVGVNNGSIQQSYASGLVSGGATRGGLVGSDAPATVYGSDAIGRTGTVTNSYWDTRTTGQATSAGGTGRTTQQLTSALPAGFDPNVWLIQPNISYPFLINRPGTPVPRPGSIPVDPGPGTNPGPVVVLPPPIIRPPATIPRDTLSSIIQPGRGTILAALPEPVRDAVIRAQGDVPQQVRALTPEPPPRENAPVIQISQPPAQGTQPGTQPGAGAGPGQPGAARPAVPTLPASVPPPPQTLREVAGPDGERFSSVPPINETRFINNEVVLQVTADVSPADVARVAQELGLTVLAQQNLGALGRVAYRFQFSGGRTIRDVIRALERNQIVAVAQPNYTFRLGQAAEPAASSQTQSLPPVQRLGDPSQYIAGKFHLGEAHRLAGGNGIIIAVIDSQIDKDHVELAGAIAQGYDAVGVPETAHPHGTAMVGAIVARERLLGVAPRARILAISAFSDSQTTAEGTSFSIMKGIDWAVAQGARVINMSFAGPHDPSLARTLKLARDKGVVLIAAAGNAGPKSPPLYPGADPSVIAVTATDTDDKLFRMANRGPQVAVAAPGVDIIAPAPAAGYQLSTGTSIATAHVSGVVALMLERDPTLTPADVRQILETTAQDLGPKGRDAQFGWGLVNPHKALLAVALRQAARSRQPTQ